MSAPTCPPGAWHLSHRTRTAVQARRIPLDLIDRAQSDPHLAYTAENYGTGRWANKRYQIAIVWAPHSTTVITVLWNVGRRWTDTQAAAAMASPTSGRIA